MKTILPPSVRFHTLLAPIFSTAVALGVLATASALADTNLWFGPGAGLNNWSTGANWTNATAGTAGNVPGSADDIKFFDTGAATPVGTINNVVDSGFGGTIASLQFGNTNNFHTTQVAPGQTLTLSGTNGLLVGTLGDVAAARNLTNTITGAGGSLNINNVSASLVLNQGTATSVSGTRANLDLSGLDNFVMNGYRIGLGTTTLPNPGSAAQREAGSLFLAKTNLITLATNAPLATYQTVAGQSAAIELSHNQGNNAAILSFLYLGQSNAFFIDSISAGRTKASANSAGVVVFNPAFSSPTALFRGIGGSSSRVTWWSIADMCTAASSSQVSVGTNDFTGGTVDARIDALSLARDTIASHTAAATIIGVLTFNNGTIDANNVYAGNQSLGPSSSSTSMLGIVNVNGPNATLVVNNNLVLGNTTQTSTAAQRTTGILNIKDGSVLANTILVGASNTNSIIAMTNGTLVVSNTIASLSKAVTTMNMTNSTLQVSVTGTSPIVVVTNLNSGGATNVINSSSVAVLASYPAQAVVLKYYGAAVGGVGFNFGFGANLLPPTAPGGYLSNNVANKSIDLVLPNDPRPVITSQPASYSGSPGDNVTFTASISPFSATPLGYQWFFGSAPLTDGPTGNGSTLSGSLTPSLTITSAQPSDNGNYTLVVTNLYGSATSAPPASLTISSGCVAPSISGGPNSTTVIQGNNATFAATVAGSPVPAIQWQRGGVNIPGATGATYTLNNVVYPADDQAVFSIIATNSCGAATNSATLTVIVPPTISVPPVSLTVTSTQPAAFSVTASGVPAPNYQWLKTGGPIAGATISSLNFANAAPSDAAVYSVIVSNAAGSVTSGGATLLVNSTMTATSLAPANGATGICPDTILKLTFDRPPVLGTAGKIRIFNATNTATPVDTINLALSSGGGTQPRLIAGASYNTYPVILSGNTASIFPHLGVLTTNQTYFVTIESVLGGAFADSSGATFEGISTSDVWQFSTKPAGPVNPTNLVVAADGSGDFCTVQGALDFIPSGNTTPRFINIRNGTYQEIVYINQKNNLTVVGQSRDQTLVTYANNDNLNGGTSLRPSFRANGNDNALVNLTLTNATPKGGSQAEALRTDGKRIVLLDVKLASFQDTLLCNNNGDLVYVQDSLIQGDTDFIWGGATVFFTNCEIRTVTSGTQVTQARTTAGTNGFSLVNCQLTRPSTSVANCGLGRDLGFTDNNVAYINCLIDSHITGWQNADARDWEYGNSNMTATAAVTYNGVQLPSNDQRLLLAQNATNWLYGWVPQLAPQILTQPQSQSVAGGASANFTVSALGLPGPAYQWLKNGAPIPSATASSYAIPSAHAGDAAGYSVIVSNSAGTATSATATLSVGNTAPSLTPISDQTINVGVTLNVTNVASDPDVPPQTLTFSLLSAPTNATLDSATGVVSWRPLVFEAGATHLFLVVVSDNGSPPLSATNSFLVTVNPVTQPTLSAPTLSGGQFTFTATGQSGPDYAVQASTDLSAWQTVFRTNSPAMPFLWADPDTGLYPIRFYRLIVGPPLP
jgi:pectin methylesterase-like acyl-CoA thioesterase